MPEPRVLGQANAVAESPAAAEAEKLAPQQYTHAKNLQARANAAHEDGSPADAQILAEQAIAAYSRAFVLARLAKAEQQRTEAERTLTNAKLELAKLDEEHQRIVRHADTLEMRVKTARDALPIEESGPTTPDREKARRDAARSLLAQARLLCAAGRLLSAERPGQTETTSKLDEIAKEIDTPSGPIPIEKAISVRSGCLKQLTLTRRPRTRAAPSSGAADALQSELGKTGKFFTFRDDRGVVVTLRGVFSTGGKLTKDGQEDLAMLGRIAKAHSTFPLLVVVHSARSGRGGTDRLEQQAEAAREALRDAGAPNVATEVVGDALPVASSQQTGAAARNQRLEIVFVPPVN
jgi:hypothetical protein